jgi:hypothetical protein
MGPLLKMCKLLHKFESTTAIGEALNIDQAPSPILTFAVPGDNREVGTCHSLESTASDSSHLDMIFPGFIKSPVSSTLQKSSQAQILMDSGASSCFISQSMVRKLGLVVRPSSLKSVATATGHAVPIPGEVTCQVKLDATTWEVTAHILPQFLPEVHLILGQNFMKSNLVILDYSMSRSILLSPTGEQIILQLVSSVEYPSREYPNTVELKSLPGPVSVAVAAHLLRRGKRAFVALIKPYDLSSITPSHPAPERPKDWTNPLGEDTSENDKQLKPDLDHVPPALQKQVLDLINEYPDIFSESPQAGGALVAVPKHAINLIPGSKPPFRKNYRLSPLELKELRTQVTDFLAKGIITPSNSPFGAPVLFIPKPNGTGLRFCLDYRALNDLTLKLRYPLPRIDDLLDAAKGAQCFSALDLASGYFQIRIAEEDTPKTAFGTPFGHFEWRVLPMGLTNAPSSFMRVMNKVFEKFLGDFVLVYLDDILIMSKSPAEHIEHLRMVFEKLREYRLQAKLSKCKFLQEQIKYLGHLLSAQGVQPDPAKIQTLLDWAFPDSAVGMQQFLGLANYFRKFIPNYSRLAAPLYHLTKKSATFLKGEEALLCFEAIKRKLVTPPLLSYPDPDLPYEVISDASISGCGAVLVQENRPVAYFSSKFSSAERNYTTGEQELLGLIKALKEWRCYLEGCQGLTLITDHNPLTFFSVQPTLSRRQARWSEFLSRFHFTVKYSPGASNPADPLSRLFPEAVLALTISEYNSDLLSKLKEASSRDPHYLDERATRKYHKETGYWTYQGRIVVPESMRAEIMTEHHANRVSGHFGWARTLELISRRFWWPKLRESVQEYVQTCASCQRNKASTKRPFGLLNPIPIPDTRWHTVTLDFIMDLPVSASGNDAILVLVDKLTKYVHLVPTRKICTAEDMSRLFLAHIFQYHGVPKVLISDRDPRFTSALWKAFCHHLGIEPRFSTAFHPETDGQTERTNRVLEEVLRHFIDGDHSNWEDLLPLAAFSMNNAKSASTGETPYYLNHGTHPSTPVSLALPLGKIPTLDVVFRDLENTLSGIKALMLAAQDRQKSYADRTRAPHEFKPGDQVLLATRNLKFQSGVKKLHPKFIGPFKILKMVGKNAAKLELPPVYGRVHPVFHVSLFKTFKPSGTFSPLPPSPEVVDGIPYYHVEKILSSREKKSGRKKTFKEYLIKWEGYDDTHNSWEPAKNLSLELLRDFGVAR